MKDDREKRIQDGANIYTEFAIIVIVAVIVVILWLCDGYYEREADDYMRMQERQHQIETTRKFEEM